MFSLQDTEVKPHCSLQFPHEGKCKVSSLISSLWRPVTGTGGNVLQLCQKSFSLGFRKRFSNQRALGH